MIIKSILLRNIRSYKTPSPIKLDTGITLFEGDIGSGKSTILSAIEFALFGLGDVDSSHLLRHGEKTGSVLLSFEVNNKPYQVYRSLERKRTSISQREGYVVENGVRTDYSVTEMKTRVLQVLNFNESPRPKTSSLIYRYAIFTPQEKMKEVLAQPVDRRLETLRRAFRIEAYSTIVNNASVLHSWLGNEVRIMEGQTKSINEKKEQLMDENHKLENLKTSLKEINNQFTELKEEHTRVLEELEKLQTRKDLVNRLDVEIRGDTSALQDKKSQLDKIHSRIQNLQDRLTDIHEAMQVVAELGPQHEEYLSKKTRRDQLEPDIQQIQELSIKRNGLQKALETEKTQLENRISDLQKEIRTDEANISNQRAATTKITELELNENKLATEIEPLTQLSEKLISLNQTLAAVQQEIKGNKTRSKDLQEELLELRKIGVGAPCPKCKQELTQQHYSKVEEDYRKSIEKLAEKINELGNQDQKTNESIEQTTIQNKTLKKKEQQLNELRQTLSGLRQQEASLKEKEEALTEKRKAFEEKKNSLSEERFGKSERQQINHLNVQLEALEPSRKEFDEIKNLIKFFEKSMLEERYLTNKAKSENKENVTLDLSESQKQEEKISSEIALAETTLQEKTEQYNQEKTVLEAITNLEEEKDIVENAKNEKNAEVIGVTNEIKYSNKEISRITSEIELMEKQLLRRDELKQYRLWISDYFIPAVKLIETNVLQSINAEFNSLFQKWLSHLLETGDITVSVDDSFTPLIEQDGYEMDVESLSGGEKTSVALAYRLALNVMVKKVCDAMHSNLLILDEPTDGFSREQLFRLREILEELNCEQVITVSHENELEGFVDKIFRITKEAGESKISAS